MEDGVGGFDFDFESFEDCAAGEESDRRKNGGFEKLEEYGLRGVHVSRQWNSKLKEGGSEEIDLRSELAQPGTGKIR